MSYRTEMDPFGIFAMKVFFLLFVFLLNVTHTGDLARFSNKYVVNDDRSQLIDR